MGGDSGAVLVLTERPDEYSRGLGLRFLDIRPGELRELLGRFLGLPGRAGGARTEPA